MTALGSLVNDAVVDRYEALGLGVEILYRGDQAESDDYTLLEDDEETIDEEYSDKDGDANSSVVTLVFYGTSVRTLAQRAKTVIDDLTNDSNPLGVAGFYTIDARLELNQRRSPYTAEGQANQHSRVVRIRYTLNPSP